MSASIFFGWKLFQLNWWKSFVPGVIFLWVLRCFASCWSTMWKMGWGLSQLCCPAQLYSPQCNGGKLFSKEIFFCEMYDQAHFSKSSAWVAGKLAIYLENSIMGWKTYDCSTWVLGHFKRPTVILLARVNSVL